MNSFDVFQILAQGIKFKSEKGKNEKAVPTPRPAPEIKKEEPLEELPKKRKKEEVDNSFQLFSSSVAQTPGVQQQKKKKKKISEREKAHLLEEERIAHLRNVNNISANGSNIPPPSETFEELYSRYHLSDQLQKNIHDCGYETPTPIQMQAIPCMLEGREVFACAPTGSGKTASFLVPLLGLLKKPSRLGFRALIVCPTRELARQIFREANRISEGTGIKPHIVSKVTQSAKKFGPNFCKKFDILISTPNRLVFLLKKEAAHFSLESVEWLVVDESDKLFEEGVRGFRAQLEELYASCDQEKLKRCMFSATYTVPVAKWCKANLKSYVSVTIGVRNTTVQDVDQELLYVGNESGKLLAFRELIQQGLSPPVLVFVQSKERAKELFNELIFDGINVDVIHADRTQLQRDNVVKAFREGKIWVLICTELMGRGIDFKGVKLVINYDFPPSAISYIHRIGRTGRAGRTGKAITYFTESDKLTLRSIATVMKESGCPVPDYMLSLKKMKKAQRKKLERSAPDRKPITTQITYEKFKRNKLKKCIEASKQRKLKGLPPKKRKGSGFQKVTQQNEAAD